MQPAFCLMNVSFAGFILSELWKDRKYELNSTLDFFEKFYFAKIFISSFQNAEFK